MRASNGALSHPNCQSSVLSSRKFGTLSLPTLLTNLFCGWGHCQRAFLDSPAVMICATDVHDLSRLFAEPSLVPQRKYFSMGAFTVSPMAASCLQIARHPMLVMHATPTARHTPSRAATSTSRTAKTPPHHWTLSPATSNRQPDFPLIAHILTYHLSRRMADVKPLMLAYKFTREIARRMPHFRGEPPAVHPAFAPSSAAAIVTHAEGPAPFDAPRIEYSDEDERVLETYVRATST
jgi:hypothetical protein